MQRQQIDGWLRCIRRRAVQHTKSNNIWERLGNLAEWVNSPKLPFVWYLESYGYQYRMTRNLPIGMTEDMEDEWVEAAALVYPWENGLGADVRRVKFVRRLP